MSLSDHLLRTCLQNEELSLNMCPEPLHAKGERTGAICVLLNSVQCKAVPTSVWTFSCSGDRVEGKRTLMVLPLCPGFGQDRVNFHQTPGRYTAGGWGLTPPGQTEPGIPYHVMSRWVPVGGAARRELSHGSGACGAGAVRESGSVSVVFSPYLYRCCYCSLCLLFC